MDEIDDETNLPKKDKHLATVTVNNFGLEDEAAGRWEFRIDKIKVFKRSKAASEVLMIVPTVSTIKDAPKEKPDKDPENESDEEEITKSLEKSDDKPEETEALPR